MKRSKRKDTVADKPMNQVGQNIQRANTDFGCHLNIYTSNW